MDSIRQDIDRIYLLAKKMVDDRQGSAQRRETFAQIEDLCERLLRINRELNRGLGNVVSLVEDARSHSRAIAGLRDADGFTEHDHLVWVLRATHGLPSPIALGPVLGDSPDG